MSDLQNGIKVLTSSIIGTLIYAVNFTQYSTVSSERQGNYLALALNANPFPDKLTVAANGKTTELTSENTNVVFRITDPKTQKISIEMTKGKDVRTKTYDLIGLTLAEAIMASATVVTPATASVIVGSKVTLTAKVTPDNATNRSISWSSDAPAIATVDAASGVVTGVKAGVANIIATPNDGSKKTGSCKVTVTAPPTLGTLAVTASALADGKTTLTLPVVGSGNMFRYKVVAANAVPTLTYNQVCGSADGWSGIPADSKVAGTTGQVVVVVECTAAGAYARKFGKSAALA